MHNAKLMCKEIRRAVKYFNHKHSESKSVAKSLPISGTTRCEYENSMP
jgi:hypothetical protein